MPDTHVCQYMKMCICLFKSWIRLYPRKTYSSTYHIHYFYLKQVLLIKVIGVPYYKKNSRSTILMEIQINCYFRFKKLDRPHYEFNTLKLENLGMKFKSIEEMFDDCVAFFKEKGLISSI